jgi:hypothetical protein
MHIHLLPRSKNECSYTSTPPIRIHGVVLSLKHRDNLLAFTFNNNNNNNNNNRESTMIWKLKPKPEWWGVPLVQEEKYQGKGNSKTNRNHAAATNMVRHHNDSCSTDPTGRGVGARSITVCHLLLWDNMDMKSANFRPEAGEGAPQTAEQTRRSTQATPPFRATC